MTSSTRQGCRRVAFVRSRASPRAPRAGGGILASGLCGLHTSEQFPEPSFGVLAAVSVQPRRDSGPQVLIEAEAMLDDNREQGLDRIERIAHTDGDVDVVGGGGVSAPRRRGSRPRRRRGVLDAVVWVEMSTSGPRRVVACRRVECVRHPRCVPMGTRRRAERCRRVRPESYTSQRRSRPASRQTRSCYSPANSSSTLNPDSRRALMVARKRAASAPSTTRWS